MRNFNYIFILIICFSPICKLYSQNAQEFCDIGYKYDIEKDYKSAIIYYTKAIKLNPVLYKAFFNRACAKEDINDIPGALNDYNEAIRINNKYLEAYYNRGTLKFNQNDLKGAIIDLSKVLEIDPMYINAYLNRGVCKFRTNQPQSACLDWEKAIKMGDKTAVELINKYCKR